MPSGVLDANVVIGLAKGKVFHLLSALYAPLYIPPAVIHEVIAQGQRRPGVRELRQAIGTWITEVAPDPNRVQQFVALRSLADREVLAVAVEEAADHVLTSDERLCREASRHGLPCLQTTELVVLMKRHGLIARAKPVLDRMRRRGFAIDEVIYQATLRAAGE